MKVSIITLHRIFNYGSILQAYATQKVFEDLGHEVEIADYITERGTNKRLFLDAPHKNGESFLRKWSYICGRAGSILIKKITFGKFLKKQIHLSETKYISADDIIRNPPIADVYVTGSDQTWNSYYNEGIDKGFFLEYAPQDKPRISFASSFGKTQLAPYEIEETRNYLSKYDAISVREDSAVQIVEDLGLHATCLIDPTLQLSKNDWMALASKRLIREKYLVLFLLYGEDNGASEMARMIADKQGLTLVKLCWHLKKPAIVDKMMTHRTPSDFLSIFGNADFVVTNSFHGLAFSLNLEKQFIVVRRNEFNSRIESLLNLMHLEEKLVVDEESAVTQASKVIDYQPIRKILCEEREKANQFIINAISDGRKNENRMQTE